MNHIFISYSRKDADAVFSIADLLRKNGVKIWQDVSGAGTGIPFSTKWFDVITEALYLASGAIVFRSENWEKSTPCKDEFELIRKCDIPYLELDPAAAAAAPEETLRLVQTFLKKAANAEENEIRTKMLSCAYEYKAGVNPYQIIPHSRGIVLSAADILYEMWEMKNAANRHDFKNRNKEIYPYILKYIRFARRTVVLRLAGMALVALMALAAIVLILAVPQAIKTGTEDAQKTYGGMAASGQIERIAGEDPLCAVNMTLALEESAVTSGSYYSLYQNGARLMDARLPARVLTEKDALYEKADGAATKESALFSAELSVTSGSVTVTDKTTGMLRTLNAPCPVNAYAWSADGERLLYAAGSAVFVYNAAGKSAPLCLSENYEPVEKVRFAQIDGALYAAAFTSRGTAVLWELEDQPKTSRRSGVYFGVFTENETPEVVFVDGNDVVISRGGAERVLSPDITGTIRTPNYDVTPDGSRIAFITESDGVSHVVAVSLEDGSVLADVETAYRATAAAFNADGTRICASAEGCAILMVDVASGKAEYGPYENRHFYNVTKFGDQWILSDLYNFCVVFDSSMKIRHRCGSVNYMFTPVFDLLADAETGYLFTVNRGGAHNYGCTRFTVATNTINIFAVPEMEHTDANTAAALSGDGKYVAFGYSNGTVLVYETKGMFLVFRYSGLGESVSAIRFADGGLYVLGAAGNVYRVDMPALELSDGDEARLANWQTLKNRLTEKKNTYISGLPAGE